MSRVLVCDLRVEKKKKIKFWSDSGAWWSNVTKSTPPIENRLPDYIVCSLDPAWFGLWRLDPRSCNTPGALPVSSPLVLTPRHRCDVS
eukprot:4724570-Prymnesium_polylepis.1